MRTGCFGGTEEERGDDVVGEGRHLRGGCHPAGEVGFEGVLIDVAGVVLLADVFHYSVWEIVEYDCGEEVACAVFPDVGLCLRLLVGIWTGGKGVGTDNGMDRVRLT